MTVAVRPHVAEWKRCRPLAGGVLWNPTQERERREGEVAEGRPRASSEGRRIPIGTTEKTWLADATDEGRRRRIERREALVLPIEPAPRKRRQIDLGLEQPERREQGVERSRAKPRTH